jgi:dTMP kinase
MLSSIQSDSVTATSHQGAQLSNDGKELISSPGCGLFVVIEGGDGAGKTSLRKQLYQLLRCRGVDILSLQGRCFLDPRFAEILTRARHHNADYTKSQILNAHISDRELLSKRILRPHLSQRHVLCDRYILSDIVYQSVLWQIDPRLTWRRYAASAVARPDLIVYVDTPPEVAVARLTKRAVGDIPRWERLDVQRDVYALFSRVLFGDDFPRLAPTIRVDNTGLRGKAFDFAANTVIELINQREHLPGRLRRVEAS